MCTDVVPYAKATWEHFLKNLFTSSIVARWPDARPTRKKALDDVTFIAFEKRKT